MIGTGARRIGRAIAGRARLLRSDPEAFARNLSQYTHPALALERLRDVPSIVPIEAVRDPSQPARLNVILPTLSVDGMTGGPNSAIHVAGALARAGTRVRFVAGDGRPADPAAFWRHVTALRGHADRSGLELASVADGRLRLGPDDRCMATFWTTAHQARALIPDRRFLYLIQDFEPGFYPWSSRYAMSLETYAMDFHPIVNQATLADFLAEGRFGRFAERDFAARASVFEPAIDRALFAPAARAVPRDGRRRLLVYARPTNPRNLLGLALAALDRAMADPALGAGWEVVAIGAKGSLPRIRLASGHRIREAPWADYRAYPDTLRSADLLLCPMLSPHTGYPVLEMASCGGISVTNSFATKTASRVRAISAAIVAVEATAEAFADALVRAARRIRDGAPVPPPPNLPSSWPEALAGVAGVMERV